MEKSLCLALGDFDGVHLGHLAVINTVLSNSDGLVPAVYTFTSNCKDAKVITDNKTKEYIFSELGIKKIIFDDFDKIKTLSPESFVNDVLLTRLNAKTVVCGEDYRFGAGATGDVKLLKSLCNAVGIKVLSVKLYNLTDKKVSSSEIRALIEAGEVESASKLMGRNFSLTGTVHHGKHLGSKNDIPTVNLDFNKDSVILKYGVYVTYTYVDGKRYNGITNVGIRPSVEKTDKPNVETFIFGFNGDLYGKEIEVEFLKMLRTEQKFETSEQLFECIRQDIKNAEKFFGEENV